MHYVFIFFRARIEQGKKKSSKCLPESKLWNRFFPYSVITNKMSHTYPEHMRSGDTIYITNGVLNKISFTFQINFELNQRNKFKLCIHSGYRNAIFYMYIYIYVYMYIFYICTVDQLGQQFFILRIKLWENITAMEIKNLPTSKTRYSFFLYRKENTWTLQKHYLTIFLTLCDLFYFLNK